MLKDLKGTVFRELKESGTTMSDQMEIHFLKDPSRNSRLETYNN